MNINDFRYLGFDSESTSISFINRILLISLIVFSCVFPSTAIPNPLNEPATISNLAQRSLLLDITKAGDDIVAVGERGHILISRDAGNTWTQSEVPVRTTLTSVMFADELYGFSVGHQGVVLKTMDGGITWEKVLDGFAVNQIILKQAKHLYHVAEERLSAGPNEQEETAADAEVREFQLHDSQSFLEEGPSRPFLDIWVKNRNEAFVIGAFGMFLKTVDGGDNWKSIHHLLENPYWFHLNAIASIGDSVFIVGESGQIFRSQDSGDSWQKVELDYDGGLFGISGNGEGELVVHGLRGTAFVSDDNGKSWRELETGTNNTLFGNARLGDDVTVLFGKGGDFILVGESGNLVGTTRQARKLPISAGITVDSEKIALVGFGGVHTLPAKALLESIPK